ncbi:MAG TPA: 2-oxo-4-hydroxy-4-carboxy-5-ureidoimidazoline decarboxylase [Candidatus Baltobacteraceae bacterium]
MTVAQLNAADRAQFIASIGFAFENSPWIAQSAWDRRPFADVDDLFGALLGVLDGASNEQRLALIAAHPDLAGRVARGGRLTAASRDEQSAAGLDRLTAQELARFCELNATYRNRFGFPFVICAREQTTASILRELDRRSQNERENEIATALAEIGKIARLRLKDVLTP